jgi:hypothetical protein
MTVPRPTRPASNNVPVSPVFRGACRYIRDVDLFFQDSRVVSAWLRHACFPGCDLKAFPDAT